MKKILFVINTLGQGGAEMALIELLKRLQGADAELSLLVLTGQGELRERIPSSVKLLNEPYYPCRLHDREGRKRLQKTVLERALHGGTILRCLPYLTGNLLRMLGRGSVQPDKLLWRLVALGTPAAKEEYDLAVAYLEGGATYYVAEKVRAKKKAAFVHIDYGRAGYYPELDKGAYLCYDRIFAVSEEVRTAFLQAYPSLREKTEIFHNFLDIGRIRRLSLEKCPEEDRAGSSDRSGWTDEGIRRLLTIGRLTPQKGYEVSIEAFARIREKSPVPVKWYVIGEGEERKALERLIAEKNLTEDFILLGNRENPYPYLRQADLYIHASRYEGKSLAIEEAQVLGKPILVSDCSGNREQVVHGTDGLICSLEPGAIAEAVLLLLQDPVLCKKLAQGASERTHNDEEQIKKLESLLEGS